MRLPWLADVLRGAGVTVVEVDGWRGRGGELQGVKGVVQHHTATPKSTPDTNVAKLLRDGRADLRGPLSQLGLDRQGRWWVIADGRANHNGYGEWANQSVGVEAFNDGRGEPWPDEQLRSWEQGTAAICRRLGFTAKQVKAHRETDPRRKIDPAGVGMDAHRDAITKLLRLDHEEDLMRDERIIVVPQPDGVGLQHVAVDEQGKDLGLFSKTSSVLVCASRSGVPTDIAVQPFPHIDALVLAITKRDGSPAPVGARARIVVEHR